MCRSRPVNAILTPTLVVSAMAALMLAGCGGGSSGSLAAATTVVTGTTAPAATVTVATKTDTVIVTSGSNGTVTASVETSKLNTETAVVVTVTKDGYETCSTTLTGLSTTGGTVNLSGCNTLTALGTGSYAPATGAVLTRLGNGIAFGEANSKLTLTTASGTTKTIEIGSPDDPSKPIPDAVFAAFKTFTVSINIRGLESNSDCNNDKITVYQAASATEPPSVSKSWTTTTPTDPNGLKASPSNGDFHTDSFVLNLAEYPITKTGGALFIKLDSGSCASGDAADDFEFVNVLGQFSN